MSEPLFGPRLDVLNKVGKAFAASWAFFWRWLWRLVVWGFVAVFALWAVAAVIERMGEPKRVKDAAFTAQANAAQALDETSALRDQVSDLEGRIDDLEGRLAQYE